MKNAETPIIVYQMGKVGSTSIYQSLSNCLPEVYHVHKLHMPHILIKEKQIALKNLDFPAWLETSRYLLNKVLIYNKPVKIITLVREPVSRNISAFFQNLFEYTGYSYSDKNILVESLIEKFKNGYNHQVPLKWFDDEFREFTGIDVFR